MTAAPAPDRPAPGWWPLDDLPQTSLTPLELGVARLGLQGRARGLAAALSLPDPGGLSRRLIAQRQGRLFVHAGHLEALCAPLPPAQARAFRTALGLPGPLGPEEVPELPAPRPRLNVLAPAARADAALHGRAASHAAHDPATDLTHAMQQLADAPGALSAYNAALASEALRGLCWHWLDTRSALHLELLGGLGETDGPGVTSARAAWQQVETTLSGARRSAARALVGEARAQHLALQRHLQEQRDARRALIRAAMQGAGDLRRGGHLNRSADVRWLTPAELRDALDGTLDPTTLRGLTQLRRLQHVAGSGVPTWRAVGQQFQAAALSTGVRDGLLHVWQPGVAVPEGRIVLCAELFPWQWPQLQGAAALLLDRAGEHSPAALHARAIGLPALSLRGRRPEWLQGGAFVRLNGHQGTLTLLRRAERTGEETGLKDGGAPEFAFSGTPSASATARSEPLIPTDGASLNASPVNPTSLAPPSRLVPSEITTISLDFDPV
ncbi:PEP-utilizing enzyme [Deinococcus koreensis]|uniref:PEP-utilising enzyme mobile domain-containing protein n=1 Tax=Deinococcus koreensis TaxID=2054903 RepID=A0A2K3V0V5_9DEIO|nr:PEP-utilizing enzyme [Deinococcus koreensis]PNY82411.1 hypothetical protein CVO96_14545 [Deinococcus koreensis]